MKKRKLQTIYLDNAATTFPKPRTVRSTAYDIIKNACGNPGRSGHHISMLAAEIVYRCRRNIAEYFGGNEENVVFTSSATHALNLGIKTSLRKGDHVLISDIEHNSVIRPITALAERGLISFSVYRADTEPHRLVSELTAKLRPNTAMVIACHHSNICNLIQPITDIGGFCRKNGLIFLVDASQSAGILDIDIERDGIDILCVPGHKALYGLSGSGFALFGKRYSDENGAILGTFIEGGNGIRSMDALMPSFLPDRLEAGTLAVPAIGTLSAGIDFVKGLGKNRIIEWERQLYERTFNGMKAFSDKLTVYESGGSGGILLFSANDIPSEELAARLDRRGICVRAGFHCAPTAHKRLATPREGAVRVSFGIMNSKKDIDILLNSLDRILHGHDPPL